MALPEKAPTISGISKFAQLSACTIVGAVIGCAATLYTYNNVRGDEGQTETVAQVSTTVEHSRIVNDEVLVRIKNVEAALDELKKAGTPILPPRPAQHHLDAAINGLFDSIEDPELNEAAADQSAPAESGDVQSGDVAGDSAEQVEGSERENAPSEAAAQQKE